MERRNDGSDWEMTRRTLLKRGAAGAGLMMASGLLDTGSAYASRTHTASGGESEALKKILDSIKSKQVILATYGGDTDIARKQVFWDPFTARTGVQVIDVDAGGIADEMQQGLIPTKWDAFHGSTDEVYAALKFGKKKIAKLPSLAWEDLIEKPYQPYMFQSFLLGYVPGVLKGTFKGTQPSSWADFYDVKKFPGKRAFPGEAYTDGTRQSALLADGVPPNKVYPMDIKRADAKIKSIWSELVFYDEFPDAQSYLTSGTVTMSFGPNGMWKELADKGVDIEVIWGAYPILEPNGMNLLPDPPNLDAVIGLACFCNNPTMQAEFAKLTNYGPPTKAAFTKLTKAELAQLPNSPGRKVVPVDTKYVGSVENELAADNKKLFA